MSDNEQRCAIKFCFRLGHNATKTFVKLQQAYGDSFLSRSQVFRWLKAYSEGRKSIEDESGSGRHSVSKTAENVVRVRDLVRSDRHLTVRMIGDSTCCRWQVALADEVRSLVEELPCLLRVDWSRPIDAESGRGKELGRSENKRPETGRS
ncbi:HTH_48 domain-containing protein [Trichonephila clavipes]|uniref:HTH_48 domain-containing protein n=1 Tax=Trichonephila clavipes TaxID=2585209 RepID=A0A8X7BFB2_TRICX|nr:HTH_48 domain-containing protein [Trichonephila clavipes]